MDFDDARMLDMMVYDLVLGDFKRGENRALINDAANGVPPYTDKEVEENKIVCNYSDLSLCRSLHDARAQFYNAFLKPGRFFTGKTDFGPRSKRTTHQAVVNNEIAKKMKRSVSYFEQMRSKFGLLCLHGISPAVWEDQDRWCPRAIGIEDALIPSHTLLGFDNLPFFALRRSFTAYELQQATTGVRCDPGWNMPLVESVIKWADARATQLMSTNWPEVWAPEKVSERIKQDTGYYASDQVPTVDCFDIYGYVDDCEKSGWVRRIILDAWGQPATTAGQVKMSRNNEPGLHEALPNQKQNFLFSSGERHVGETWQNIISFMFADLSAVAPFRYHSVRSLGWLLYGISVVQNRMRCKFSESVFEALMKLFKVKSMDDVERALKVELINHGFIDDTITPVPATERWQVNSQLVELGLRENNQLMGDSQASFAQRSDFSRDRTEKTRYQVMAELNAGNALVGAAIAQAYQYYGFECREIFRRFMRPNSKDPDVIDFRANCLRAGVPSKLLSADLWEVEPERVLGAGNKTMELTQAQQLMEWRPLFDPDPQREILRDAVMAFTDDPAKSIALVPFSPNPVTDSVHDAQLAAGTLLQGLPVAIKTGINHGEYIEAMMRNLAALVMQGKNSGAMVAKERLAGLINMAQHIGQHLSILAQNKAEKSEVKRFGDALGKTMNEVKAFAHRLQQQGARGNGQTMDPKDLAKIQAITLQAQTKAQLASQSHAQRTAQRQVQFEQEMRQKATEHRANLTATDLEAQSKILRNRLSSMEE